MHAFTRLRSFVSTTRDRIGPLTRETIQKFQRERVDVLSAALAYFALFSLFPLLLITLSVIGLVVGNEESALRQVLREQMGLNDDTDITVEDSAYQQIVDFVDTSISPDVAVLIDDTLQQLNEGGLQASIVGALLLLWAASNVFSQINITFQHLWGAVPDPQSNRPIWKSALYLVRRRMLSFGLVMLSALIFLVSLAVNATITLLSNSAPEMLRSFAWSVGSFGGGVVLLLAVLLLLFKYLPNMPVAWGDVWFGALGTTIMLTLLVNLGNVLLGRVSGMGYGVVGTILTLLIWFFLGSIILYTGALVSAVYARMYGSLSPGKLERSDNSPPAPFVDAA